ncbi:MAG: hypothetical protein GMKNLPBB_00488 [Myxococcota bacterium]|nr:hypothetical protein [Myxococcota bacterium]
MALVFAGASVYALAQYWRQAQTRPAPADWDAAGEYLRSKAARDDVVAVLPFFAERARQISGDLNLIFSRSLEKEDLSIYRNLYAVSLFGEHDRAKDRFPPEWRAAGSHRFGKIEVITYALPPPLRVTMDLVDQADKADVWMETPRGKVDCRRWGVRHGCSGSESWNYVGPTSLNIDEKPRRCLWAHPVTGETKVVQWKNVEMGSRLLGYAGLSRTAVTMGGMPVQLTVESDGEKIASVTVLNESRIFPFDVDTGKLLGKRATLTFRVTTPHDGGRHFCFAGEIRAPAEAPATGAPGAQP